MGPKKKGGKGKKGKKGPPDPEQVTTLKIIDDRTKMLCPRMGDVYFKTMQVEEILTDCVDRIFIKAADRQYKLLPLSGMKMNTFPDISSIAAELTNLVDVNLSKNLLFNMDQLFAGLALVKSIKKLNLSQNFLNGVVPESAGALEQLESLNLDVNQLTGLSPQAVCCWKMLKHFSMADNSVSALPEELAEWKAVEHINVKNNKLAELPPSIFQSFPVIQRLYLGGNLLKSLPEQIGQCSTLVALDFSNNQIEALPIALEQCTNLELLHCGCNKIVDVQPEIFASLTKLKELQLYKNKLTIVPPEIGNLSCIERISLASNNLKTLPDEIGSCTTLQELYLGNNAKFSNFPASAGHLHRLRELSLRKCPALKQLPNTAMEMTSLKELDVRAMKKEVCKIAQEVADALGAQQCVLRGGVIKKGKPAKKAKEG